MKRITRCPQLSDIEPLRASYLRIQVELAMRAKGAFLMQKSGYAICPDPEIREKFEELRYLERQIGKTGKHAVAPFVRTRSHDLWQLNT